MDLQYTHGTDVYCVRACCYEDATDLLAIAGASSVEILQCNAKSVKVVAAFYLGLRPTAVAWSPRTTSPGISSEWFLELAVSTHDFGLHLLTQSASEEESVFHFGGGLTGHHARINDLCYVGGPDRNARHLASVSDDKNLIVWDLFPSSDLRSGVPSPSASPSASQSVDGSLRPQPTALVIPFAYPLTSVSSHLFTSKQFVVSDSRGSVFLTDWRRDPNEEDEDAWHHQSVVELVHPRALADSVTNLSGRWTGGVSWRADDPDIVGAVYSTGYALWNMSNLQGGKPFATGVNLLEGGHRFRWSPSYPEYFGITSNSPLKGAAVHVCNTSYLQAQPTVISISPRPHRVLDFDWLASRGVPRIAAAVGRIVYIFPISLD